MDEMVARLRRTKRQLFVVIYGAHVDEIDKVLLANDLFGRPIFQSRDRAIVLAGPWGSTAISPTTNYPANQFPTSPNGLNINPAPDPQPFFANPPASTSPLVQQQSSQFFK